MVAPQHPPMAPKHFVLRVYSVKRDEHGDWEVRAEERLSEQRSLASLFYRETDPRNLPPMDSSIHVLLDDQLTTEAPVAEHRSAGELVLDAEAALAEEDK